MRKALCLGVILGLMMGCGGRDSTTPPVTKEAHFILVSSTQDMTGYGCPCINGTVKNDGTAMGYNVEIKYYAYNSSNTIIDTASGFPADLGDIAVGVSATFEAVFFNLTSWSQIDHTTYQITWISY